MNDQDFAYWHQKISTGWEKFGPPARPSKSEIKIIQDFIVKNKIKKETLILGATPEYRDLAHNLKKSVTVFDCSIKMIEEMSNHMRNQNKLDQEKLVKANWLDCILQKEHWDLILGDFVVANIPLKLQNKFYEMITNLLKRGGYFITRMYFPDNTKINLNELIDLRLKKKISYNELHLGLISLAFNPKTGQTSTFQAMKIFNQYIQKNRKFKKELLSELNLYKNLYGKQKIWWPTPQKQTALKFKKYFIIKAIQKGNDHFFIENCPVYLLRKK